MPDAAETASREGWRRTMATGERLAAEATVAPRAAGHARRLSARAAGRWPAPDAVEAGYWPSLCLTWSAAALEIEIHDDRLELYRFGPGVTEIREWRCGPDETAADLLDDLLHAAFGGTP